MSGEGAGTPRLPTVSVIIAAFSMQRWDNLCEAVASVQAQTIPVLETIVVIDHHPDLLARARGKLLGVTLVENGGDRGASAARNTGVKASHGEIVAFLDDDAIASPRWLEALLRHFGDDSVVGVGGRLDPLWANSRPGWFPPEFDWVVGVSYRGMPTDAEPVRNVWSNNMAIRRQVFDSVGGFRDDFGKVGVRPRPEDTDLCLRTTGESGEGIWIYEPAAAAEHRVSTRRTTLRYFTYRCFNEGWGKAELAALNGIGKSTSAELEYSRHVLPAALTRGLREAYHGEAAGISRNLAIVAGFGTVMIGYLASHIALTFRITRVRRHHLEMVTERVADDRRTLIDETRQAEPKGGHRVDTSPVSYGAHRP